MLLISESGVDLAVQGVSHDMMEGAQMGLSERAIVCQTCVLRRQRQADQQLSLVGRQVCTEGGGYDGRRRLHQFGFEC